MVSVSSFKYGHLCLKCAVIITILSAALCASQDPNFICSRATYYGSPDCYGTPTGACGFGEFGRTVNDGFVAAASRLYKDGSGCAACYQVKCTKPQLCSDDGVNIVVTDYGEGDNTDFILSPRAYAKLARPNAALELFGFGVVDMQYKRIPCQYSANNLMFKVHEHSRFPHYLAILILYQGGQNDILALQLWQEDCKEWKGMRRAFGAVWDMPNPPTGPIKLRFQVSGSAGQKWVEASNAIPSDWNPGVAYDSAIKLT